MCPVCMTTLALIASSSASTGGLTAFVVKKLRKVRRQAKDLPVSSKPGRVTRYSIERE